jgi:hypothetical protein
VTVRTSPSNPGRCSSPSPAVNVVTSGGGTCRQPLTTTAATKDTETVAASRRTTRETLRSVMAGSSLWSGSGEGRRGRRWETQGSARPRRPLAIQGNYADPAVRRETPQPGDEGLRLPFGCEASPMRSSTLPARRERGRGGPAVRPPAGQELQPWWRSDAAAHVGCRYISLLRPFVGQPQVMIVPIRRARDGTTAAIGRGFRTAADDRRSSEAVLRASRPRVRRARSSRRSG